MRQNALVPTGEAEVPEPYRLWRLCQTHGPWYAGGTSAQPHLMLLEFAACAAAYAAFQNERSNMENILRGNL